MRRRKRAEPPLSTSPPESVSVRVYQLCNKLGLHFPLETLTESNCWPILTIRRSDGRLFQVLSPPTDSTSFLTNLLSKLVQCTPLTSFVKHPSYRRVSPFQSMKPHFQSAFAPWPPLDLVALLHLDPGLLPHFSFNNESVPFLKKHQFLSHCHDMFPIFLGAG